MNTALMVMGTTMAMITGTADMDMNTSHHTVERPLFWEMKPITWSSFTFPKKV